MSVEWAFSAIAIGSFAVLLMERYLRIMIKHRQQHLKPVKIVSQKKYHDS